MTADIEMRWVELWNQLCEFDAAGLTLVKADTQTICSLEEAKAIAQNAVYKGKVVSLAESWFAGKKSVFISIDL